MWDVAFIRSLKSFVFDDGFFVMLFVVALLVFRQNRKHLFKPVAAGILFFQTIYCFAPFSDWLSSPLLTRASLLASAAKSAGCLETFPTVVVLGGGFISPTTPSTPTYERVSFAVQFLRALPKGERKLVILSGGPATTVKPEADLMVELFRSLGGAEQAIVETERESLNTYGNAVLTKEALMRANLRPRVILITNALHMPRAYATFTTQGFQVCALPVMPAENAQVSDKPLVAFANGVNTFNVLNEMLGIIGYGLRGWLKFGAVTF